MSPRRYDECQDLDTCKKSIARLQSSPTSLHKYVIKEKARGRDNAVERLHGGRSSSTRANSGRPPLQPQRRRRMSGVQRSVSLKESHKDPGAGEAPQRGNIAFERLQQRDSKWYSGSGGLADRPPSQPFIRRGISGAKCASTEEYQKDSSLKEPRPERSIRILQQSDDSRWSSGSRATFDMAPVQALEGRSIRRLKQSDNSC